MGKEEKEFKFPMIIWEDMIIAPKMIKEIKPAGIRANEESEQGYDYTVELITWTEPFDRIYRYSTEEVRDRKLLELKNLMVKCNTIFIQKENEQETTSQTESRSHQEANQIEKTTRLNYRFEGEESDDNDN